MLNKIKQDIIEICESKDAFLYDMSFEKEGQDKILRILVDTKDGIDLDLLVLINQEIGEFLDNKDVIDDDEYMLEVASPGAERPIKSEDQLTEAIGEYIFVKTFEQEFYGYLENYKNGIIELKINQKGRIKIAKINYVDVQKLRLAIKF